MSGRAAGGVYRRKPREFVLPPGSLENLFPTIRVTVPDYFRRNKISWHSPTHLLSSQVFCVNFLEPFAFEPDALRRLFEPIVGPIDEMLEPEPTSHPGRFVAYEFIGGSDYLNEARGTERARGANCTSVDAAIRFRTQTGAIEVALIEWKYTESYKAPAADPRNEERKRRYQNLAFHPDGPLRPDLGIELVEFFTEPIYQLLRQQMLAMQMEKAHELGATRVRTILVVPGANLAFKCLKIGPLRAFGEDVTSAWHAVLQNRDHFILCLTEDFFVHARAAIVDEPGWDAWRRYVGGRYDLEPA